MSAKKPQKKKAASKRSKQPSNVPAERSPHNRDIEPVGMKEVPVESIDETDTTFQFRFGAKNRKQLQESMKENGLIKPVSLMAQEDGYVILDGFGRVTVAKQRLGWKNVKALIYPGMSDQDAKKVAFQANVLRENYSAMEKANAMQLLREEHGMTLEQVANWFNTSRRTVKRYLDLPEFILKLVDGACFTMAHAHEIAKFAERSSDEWNEGKVQELAEEVYSKKMTQKQLRKRLHAETGGPQRRYTLVRQNEVRGYAFRISENSPLSEIRKAAENLRNAAEALDGLAETKEDPILIRPSGATGREP